MQVRISLEQPVQDKVLGKGLLLSPLLEVLFLQSLSMYLIPSPVKSHL